MLRDIHPLCYLFFLPDIRSMVDSHTPQAIWTEHSHSSTLHLIPYPRLNTAPNNTLTPSTLTLTPTTATQQTGASSRSSLIPVGEIKKTATEDENAEAMTDTQWTLQ